MRDIKFLSGEFFETEIPQDKKFLLKYFDKDTQEAFLRFYLVFNDWRCFTQFTGIAAGTRYLRKLEKRLNFLLTKREEAKLNFDMDTVWRIETGKFKINEMKE